jgi:5-methylcytosine-specific restriction endonuclease McrA
MANTLLLDQGYQPIKVISWRRAICMSFLGKVEVLSEYEWSIGTVAATYPAPAVVRLLHHVRRGPHRVRFSRRNVYLRDGHQCQYCRQRLSDHDLTLDHVVPRSHGGGTTWKNIVAACRDCNRQKGGRTPEQAGLTLGSVPRRPDWIARKAFRLALRAVPEAWRAWIT